MKKHFIVFLVISLILIFSNNAYCEKNPVTEAFISVIEKLGKSLEGKGIKLKEGEEIKDVATFGYFNAINELGAQFGHLDSNIEKRIEDWLKIWCWLPSIPEDKKEKMKDDIVKIRKELSRGIYRRTLASLTIVPGFVVTSVGEVFPTKQIFGMYPVFRKSQSVFGTVTAMPRPSPGDISTKITKDEFGYKDIINSDWVTRYLK